MADTMLSVEDAGILNSPNGELLIIGFECVNNATDSYMWESAWNITAFQDGIQLNEKFSIDSNGTTEVLPNSTLPFVKGFYLRNATSPVIMEVKASFSFSNNNIM